MGKSLVIIQLAQIAHLKVPQKKLSYYLSKDKLQAGF